MKKFLLVLFAFVGLGFWSVNAQTLLTDDFNYADGALLSANGWTAYSSAGAQAVDVGASNGLTYTGYTGIGSYTDAVVGNAVRLDNTGEDVSRSFASQTGSIFTSFTLNVINATTGYFFLYANSATTFCSRVWVKPSGTAGKFNLGISNGNTASYAATPTDFNLNQTYLIMVKYVVSSQTSYLWVISSGVPTSEVAAGAVEHSIASGGLANVDRIGLRQFSATQSEVIDGIRVSATWSDALPVELKSLTANASGNNVKLNWSTATEQNNLGFEVERSLNVAEKNWVKVGFVAGNGTTNKPNTYSYTDGNVNAGSYSYRLKQVDKDGAYKYSSFVNVDITAPSHFALEQNYPNPFNPSTVISYSLPTESNVSLKVFNALGQEVKNLESGVRASGLHTFNLNASELTSGIYYYTLKATSTDGKSNYSQTKKMMLVK